MTRQQAHAPLIDLGASWTDGLPDEPPRGVRPRRLLAAAATVLAVLAGSAGAAPDPAPRLAELARWRAQVNAFTPVGADTVLVTGNGGTAARDLSDGRLLWTLPDTADGWLQVVGDLVLLHGESDEPPADQPQLPRVDTTALDRRTGQVRWRADAFVEPVGSLLLNLAGDPRRPTATVHDRDTFALRWHVPPALALQADDQASRLWRLTAGGDLVEHDLVTGVVRRTVRLSRPPNVDSVAVALSRDAIGFSWQRRSSTGFPEPVGQSWYDRATLAPVAAEHRWNRTVDCGRGALCAYQPWASEAFLIDAGDGRVLRALPDGTVGSPAGPLRFEESVGGSMMASGNPATGGLQAEVAGWRALSREDDFVRMLGLADGINATTHVAQLTRDGMRPLGTVPGLLNLCSSPPGALICATSAGEVVLWRVGEEP